MEKTIQIHEPVETQIDVLVQDIMEITTELLEQYARDRGEESPEIIRVS